MVSYSRDGRLDATFLDNARLSSRHKQTPTRINQEPNLLMKKHLATITQVIGSTMVSVSLGLVAIPLGLGFAGIAIIAFGIAAERTP